MRAIVADDLEARVGCLLAIGLNALNQIGNVAAVEDRADEQHEGISPVREAQAVVTGERESTPG